MCSDGFQTKAELCMGLREGNRKGAIAEGKLVSRSPGPSYSDSIPLAAMSMLLSEVIINQCHPHFP
jgi:hypothetical protein